LTKKEMEKQHQKGRREQEKAMESSVCNSILFAGKHARKITKAIPTSQWNCKVFQGSTKLPSLWYFHKASNERSV
jgi:hypothetical protein